MNKHCPILCISEVPFNYAVDKNKSDILLLMVPSMATFVYFQRAQDTQSLRVVNELNETYCLCIKESIACLFWHNGINTSSSWVLYLTKDSTATFGACATIYYERSPTERHEVTYYLRCMHLFWKRRQGDKSASFFFVRSANECLFRGAINFTLMRTRYIQNQQDCSCYCYFFYFHL